MMTLTVEIPALDRLCGILEQRDRGNIVAEIEHEIVKQLEQAARGGTLEKAAKAPAPACEKCADYVTAQEEAAQATSSVTADAVPPERYATPAAAPQGEGLGKPVTLADVQKAAAQMRDDGKLEAVKGLFPEFGIKKLSDLKGDALQGFAARLREMGAKI